MAKKNIKNAEVVKSQFYTVVEPFTYDKKYYKGDTIELSHEHTIGNLLTKKIIK